MQYGSGTATIDHFTHDGVKRRASSDSRGNWVNDCAVGVETKQRWLRVLLSVNACGIFQSGYKNVAVTIHNIPLLQCLLKRTYGRPSSASYEPLNLPKRPNAMRFAVLAHKIL
jgi:hypothetical protein